MSQYTLSGSGQQTLSPGVSQIRLTVTALGNGYSTGIAVPTNYYKLGELRLGAGGFFYPMIPIDATQQLIDVPAGVDTLGYGMQNSQTVTAVEVFAAPANFQKQPWDRNPHARAGYSQTQLPPLAAPANVTAYTVPASKLFLLSWMEVEIYHTTVATAPNVVTAQGIVAGQGLLFLAINGQPIGVVATDRFDGQGLVLVAGQTVQYSMTSYEATGNAYVNVNWAGTEFDA
jgi:hypothetical protein